MDPKLLQAIIGGGLFAAFASILVALFKQQTDRQANKIAERRLLVEMDEQERKEMAERHEEERKRRAELRADLEHCERRCDQLEEKLERKQSEVEKLQEELRQARTERDEAKNRAREGEHSMSLRLYQCEKAGMPCQPRRDTTETPETA